MDKKNLDLSIKKYINGDNNEFNYIYEETKKYVYLSIYTYIKNQMVIDDLMQDTYLKAIDNLKNYQLGTNFYAWISRIARNIAINYYNKYKKEEIVEEHLTSENHNNDSLVSFALDVLDGLEKEVLVYHIVLNMKFEEISKIFEKPLGTVYSIYKKALSKVKKKL